ncbi:phosphoglycerate kinase, partial [Candidatus Bathyarchaeota archaeon]|nr:phosphoglycerate kinase [Candidatus Bathyarchaeota archaeon]
LVRVDFNSPLDSNKNITDDTRIRMHAPTIRELMNKGAKVVILAHQGRPGDTDYSTMQKHSERLSEILGEPVEYVDDLFGEKAVKAIKGLETGEALLLENVRSVPDELAKKTPEEFAKTPYIKTLAGLADIYIDDGFAVAHRANASLVGFPVLLPAAAGRVMEKELKALNKVKKAEEKPCIYIMGGAKADDAAAISEYVLGHDTADYVLTGGVIGNLFLHAKGVKIGGENTKFLDKKGFLQHIPKIQELFKKFDGKILVPEDFGIEIDGKRKDITTKDLPTKYSMLDIGPITVKDYSKIIEKAKIIVVSGPMGVYERNEFMLGTKGVFEAVANSKAFSVIGGGNTIEAVDKLGISKKVSYISTGGGALMEFLTGKVLPGVEALEKAAKK